MLRHTGSDHSSNKAAKGKCCWRKQYLCANKHRPYSTYNQLDSLPCNTSTPHFQLSDSATMSSIVSALSDLVSSMVEVVWSFFTTALHLVENTAQFAAKFATEIVELVINFFKGLVDLAGGIVSFLVGKLRDCQWSAHNANNQQATSSCLQSLPRPSSASSSISAARVVQCRSATRS
jgi:hypothetical protein